MDYVLEELPPRYRVRTVLTWRDYIVICAATASAAALMAFALHSL